MRNCWRLVLVMALVLGAYGGGNDSGGTQLAAAAISPTTATIRPSATGTTATTKPMTKGEAPGGSGGSGGSAAEGSRGLGRRLTVSYQVARGDNLWSIAKQHLAVRRERSPKEFSNHKIAPYWLRVVAANARTLVSGDPDLIYPGEMIVLPPVASAPTRPAPADQTQTGQPAPSPSTTGPTTTGPTTTGPATPPTAAAPSTTSPRPPAYDPSPAPSATNPPDQGGPDEPNADEGKTPPKPPQQTPHSVIAGDNLWTIARDRLTEALGGGSGKPTNREVANYWLQVIEANRHRLRSGDPDLIHPGETIVLPPID